MLIPFRLFASIHFEFAPTPEQEAQLRDTIDEHFATMNEYSLDPGLHPAGHIVVVNATGYFEDVFEQTPSTVLSNIHQAIQRLPGVQHVLEIYAHSNPELTLNNELIKQSGYFFNPPDKADLVELTYDERLMLLNKVSSLPFGIMPALSDADRGDVLAYMTNNTIPTHKKA